MVSETACLKQFGYNSHNASAAIVVDHRCRHCAIAVQVRRCSDLSKIDFRIRDGSRSGTVVLLVYNEYHGFCCISRGKVHLRPSYGVEILHIV